jgi:hypothetical protein
MAAIIKTTNQLIIKAQGWPTKTISLDKVELVKKVYELLKRHAGDAELIQLIDVGERIKQHSSGLFGVDNGIVYVGSEALPTTLSNRVIDFADAGLPFEPLLNFWNNCKLNPDVRAKTDLYKFLETNGHPITFDGCFIGYRSVKRLENGNLVDWQTGTFDNNVGAKPSMKREDCDTNPDAHCSKGFHVAQMAYAVSFNSGSSQVIVEVKVNPKDVVAIPTDCNGQKMRVCEFEVVDINREGQITKPLYDNVEDEVLSDDSDDEEELDTAGPTTTKQGWQLQKRDASGRFV